MVVHEDTHGNRVLTKSGLTELEADAILARFALNKPHNAIKEETGRSSRKGSRIDREAPFSCTRLAKRWKAESTGGTNGQVRAIHHLNQTSLCR